MQNTKLVEILSDMATRERSRFQDYVHSPFFNKNKKIQNLCDYVLSYAPDFHQPALNKTVIYPFIFGKKPFNEIQLNNIISDLLQLLYDFLAIKKYREKELLQKTFLMDELLDRSAYDFIPRVARRYRQIQNQSTYRNFEFYHQEYIFSEQLDRNHLSRSPRTYGENLQFKNDHLDLYYFSNKLRIACDMASRNIVVKAKYECHFIADLIKHYEDNYLDYQSHPCLSVYYKILQILQTKEDEQAYYELKTLLENHYNLFPAEELRVIYIYVQNYCILKINSGKSIYYRELQDVYKILLKRKIIFMNGYLTQWAYKNIITVGIRLQDFDWTETVIHQYKESLLPEERPNAVAYNLAAFYDAKKEYKNALHQLHDVEFTDISYHLGAKIIQLKCFYELDESEAFYALIEATKKYLLRNRKVADYHKKANANFCTIAKKIFQLKMKKSRLKKSVFNQQYRLLSEKLKKIQPITNKEWLEEACKKLDLASTK